MEPYRQICATVNKVIIGPSAIFERKALHKYILILNFIEIVIQFNKSNWKMHSKIFYAKQQPFYLQGNPTTPNSWAACIDIKWQTWIITTYKQLSGFSFIVKKKSSMTVIWNHTIISNIKNDCTTCLAMTGKPPTTFYEMYLPITKSVSGWFFRLNVKINPSNWKSFFRLKMECDAKQFQSVDHQLFNTPWSQNKSKLKP